MVNDDIVVLEVAVLIPGRIVALRCAYRGKVNMIVNCYLDASNNLANKRLELETLNAYLENAYRTFSVQNVVVCGDFNIDLMHPNRIHDAIFRPFLVHNNLIDFPKIAFLNENITRRGGGQMADSSSRIDTILATANYFWPNFELIPNAFSDHLILSLGEAPSPPPPPKPRWEPYIFKSKFFLDRAKTIIHQCLTEHVTFQSHGQSIKIIDSNINNCNCVEPASHASLVFKIIKKLEPIYYLTRNKHRVVFRKEEQTFVNVFRRLTNRIDDLNDVNDKTEVKRELTELLKSRRARVLETSNRGKAYNSLRKLADTGRATRYAFSATKPRQRSKITNLVRDGAAVQNDDQIAATLTAHHMANTLSDFEPPPFQDHLERAEFEDLEERLAQKGFDVYSHFSPNMDFRDEDFSLEDVKAVLRTLNTHAAPGPSGQNASLFRFIFSIIPNTLVSVFNQLRAAPELEDSEDFAWIKKRTIIMIKKKNRVPTDPASYRPISLLEIIYKILSKLLINRVNPHVSNIVSSNQVGFVQGRQMHLSSATILNLLNKINHGSISSQMISLDVKAAFDTAKPHVIHSLLKILFPTVPDFLYQLHRWTSRGSAIITANGCEGQLFYLSAGTGQGDPSSSTRFLILQHLQAAYVHHALQTVGGSFFLPDDNVPVPPLLFADDTFMFAQLTNIGQTTEFLEELQFIGSLTGLHMNRSKTKIITLFPPDEDFKHVLRPLGEVTDEFTHLGIVWSKTVEASAKATYRAAFARLQAAIPRITNITSSNIYHRAMLVKAILPPIFHHIFRIFYPSTKECNRIDVEIRKALWTRRFGDVEQRRHKIAKERLGADYDRGGLKLYNTNFRAFKIVLKAQAATLRYCNSFPGSVLGRLEDWSSVSQLKGSGDLAATKKFVLRTLLITRTDVFFWGWIKKLSAALEALPEWIPNIALQGSIYAPLVDISDYAISQLPGSPYCLSNVLINSNGYPTDCLKPQFRNIPGFSAKIVTLIQNIKRKLPHALINYDRVSIFTLGAPVNFLEANVVQSIFAFPNKVMTLIHKTHFASYPEVPPSYSTRQRDDVEVPRLADFLSAYSINNRRKIDYDAQAFQLEVLNRTLWSENKKFKSGMIDEPPECIHCSTLMDSFHQTIGCIYMVTFMRYFRGFILTHELTMRNWDLQNVTLDCMYYTAGGPSKLIQEEFFHLIIKVKMLSFSAHLNPRWLQWSRFHLFANISRCLREVINFRRFVGRPVQNLLEFQSHILMDPNRTMLLEPLEWLR